MNTTPEHLVSLRQILATRFNKNELRTLCFDLRVDYEDLPGRGRAGKARELVAHLDRHSGIAELIRVCERMRPDIDWGAIPKAVETTPPKIPSDASRKSPGSIDNPPRVLLEPSLEEPLESIAQQMKAITKPYIQSIQHTLGSHSLKDFVEAQDLPDVIHPQRWWERILKTGKGLNGDTVSFLRDYERLKDLSIEFKAIAKTHISRTVREQTEPVIALLDTNAEIYSQYAKLGRVANQENYRKNHLRSHIKAVQDLDTALDSLCPGDN